MRVSLGQRFWIFAALFAVATAALVGVFVTNQIGDYRRYTRTLELTESFHAAVTARTALAREYQATERALALPAAGSGPARADLEAARAETDAAVTRVMSAAVSDGDRAEQALARRLRSALRSGRAVIDRQLAVPLDRRTAAGVARALTADSAATAALRGLLDRAEGEIRSTDAESALGVTFVRLAADVHDRATRQARDVVPALVAGAPVTATLRRRAAVAHGQLAYVADLAARRASLFDGDDPRIAPAIAQIDAADYPVVEAVLSAGDADRSAVLGRLAATIAARSDVAADLAAAAVDVAQARAQEGRDDALRAVIWSLVIAAVVIVALIVFLVWSRRSVLAALRATTNELVALANGDTSAPPARPGRAPPELEALYAAVADLRRRERHRALIEAERTALQARLRHEATTDALTGLFNRRAVTDIGTRWAAGGDGAGAPLGVIIADLDHFKAINDTHGHLVGDRVLEIAARRLSAAVRPTDTVARYGGEEFLILAPGIGADDLWRLAEDLRRIIGEHPFVLDGVDPLYVRISAGIARAHQGECGWADLLAAADAALYRAKAGGRDQVAVGELARR